MLCAGLLLVCWLERPPALRWPRAGGIAQSLSDRVDDPKRSAAVADMGAARPHAGEETRIAWNSLRSYRIAVVLS
jgi:hypothetical protein